MLTIRDPNNDRNCQGFARREFLKIGALGFGGLGLPSLLEVKARAAEAGIPVTGKSVVFLFLQGGPAHIEMFDPKPEAPVEIGSITGHVSTKLPGVQFGGTFPQMGQIADRLAVVRSYASQNSGHTYQAVASGGNELKATMGALYARVAGTTEAKTGMPTNTLILPEAIQPDLKLGKNFETGALPTLTAAGELGPNFAAFNPTGGGQLRQNMELKLPPARFDDRRYLLSRLDRIRRPVDADGLLEGVDKYQQQAFEVISRGVADAFDLTREDARTIARYDTSHLFTNKEVQRWGDMRRSSNLLGKQMLLARRLCEAGCGFVTVSDCGWDMHSNGNSPKHLGGMWWLGPQVDHAVAAFVQDVEERGLTDKILLVVTGEMGRSPRINRNGGRDHYGGLTSLVFAGGGLKMGQVIGQSDNHATKPATTPYSPKNLLATVMHTLFDVGQLRISSSVRRDLIRITDSTKPIDGLL